VNPENAVETLRRQVRATQRVAALRQRRAEQGLVRLELYVHPDDHAAVKAVAQALTQQRSCKPACTPAPESNRILYNQTPGAVAGRSTTWQGMCTWSRAREHLLG
jgi:hypothetical protein